VIIVTLQHRCAECTNAAIAGCAEIFQADWSPEAGLPGNLAAGRRPAFAVNCVSTPLVDGTTLGSWLDSIFGPGQGDGRTRLILMKSAIMLVALAQGTPQLAAADLKGAEVARFASAALAARRRHATIMLPAKFNAVRDVAWFTEHGHAPQWGGTGAGDAVLGQVVRTGGALGSSCCLFVNSSWQSVSVQLPPTPGTSLWRVQLDSGSDMPDDVCAADGGRPLRAGSNYVVAPKGAVLLSATPAVSSGIGAVGVVSMGVGESQGMRG
jgi:hypothetical protein